MKALTKGSNAPDFTLTSPDGVIANISAAVKGGPVVLVFLPDIGHTDASEIVDNFRDDFNEFSALKASIVAVLRADSALVEKMHEEHQLNFPLFPDPAGGVFKMYGAVEGFLVKKPRKYAFIIDRDGTITKVFRSVDSNKFSRQALYALRDQMGRSALRNTGKGKK